MFLKVSQRHFLNGNPVPFPLNHHSFFIFLFVVLGLVVVLFQYVIVTLSLLGGKAWCCTWKRDFWQSHTPTSRNVFAHSWILFCCSGTSSYVIPRLERGRWLHVYYAWFLLISSSPALLIKQKTYCSSVYVVSQRCLTPSQVALCACLSVAPFLKCRVWGEKPQQQTEGYNPVHAVVIFKARRSRQDRFMCGTTASHDDIIHFSVTQQKVFPLWKLSTWSLLPRIATPVLLVTTSSFPHPL